jgi:hypothetical protein
MMLAKQRIPVAASAKRRFAGVGGPVGVRRGLEDPIWHVHRLHLDDLGLFCQIAGAPESLPQPLPQQCIRLIARHLKRYHG